MRSISDKLDIYRCKHNTLLKILALLVMCALLLICVRAGTQQAGSPAVYAKIPSDSAEFQTFYPYLTPTTLDMETQMTDAKTIDLSAIEDELVLNEGGAYFLTGKLNGSIRINAPEENVHLFLGGVKIKAVSGPAVCCESADKLLITLLPDAENRISDSGRYAADGETEACIYSICDLTLNGDGKLTVDALYKDAVRSKDLLKIMSGEYTIRCKRTAFHGNDGIYVENGSGFVSSEKYGFKTTKKGSDGRGNLIVCGGEWNILAGRYAFVTTMADLVIYNCNITQNSIVSAYDVGGRALIDSRCDL